MIGDYPTTIRDGTATLEALRHVQRRYGDNEGDPLAAQEAVDSASYHVREYCSDSDGTINARGMVVVRKRGYRVCLGPCQHDPSLLAGCTSAKILFMSAFLEMHP